MKNDYSEYPEIAERLEKANAKKRIQNAAMEAGTAEIRRLMAENNALRATMITTGEENERLRAELRKANMALAAMQAGGGVEDWG